VGWLLNQYVHEVYLKTTDYFLVICNKPCPLFKVDQKLWILRNLSIIIVDIELRYSYEETNYVLKLAEARAHI